MTTVKQLVWRYYPDAFPPASDAVTPFGRYSIEEGMSNNTEDPALPSDAYPTWNVYFSSGLLSVWRTLDEAKASAQADFEQRVRSALSASSPPVGGSGEVVALDRETIARAVYETDPHYESGEYVDSFPVSPGGTLTWEQALARDAEFAGDRIMLPITKFAFDAADRIRSALAAPVPNGVPEGWKLVPVDITEEMWTAFFKARDVTFPAQQEAAQAAGRGWNGLPAVVWEALLAASPVTPEGLSGDWQDISTAPKDGSDVLCYGEYYSNPCRFVAHWNGVQWYAGWGDAIQPTLWQPLPATPAKTV